LSYDLSYDCEREPPAVVRSCGRAVVPLCGCAVVRLCGCALVLLCGCGICLPMTATPANDGHTCQ
jgi:hypothetical protein